MGPRPYGRGNAIKLDPTSAGANELQWGRDRTVAEIAFPLSYSVFKDLYCPARAARLIPPLWSSRLLLGPCKLFKSILLIPCERPSHFLRRPAARAGYRVTKTG